MVQKRGALVKIMAKQFKTSELAQHILVETRFDFLANLFFKTSQTIELRKDV